MRERQELSRLTARPAEDFGADADVVPVPEPPAVAQPDGPEPYTAL